MPSRVQLLIEKTGKMCQYWQQYQRETWAGTREEWSEEEYQRRKALMLEQIDRVQEELTRRRQRLEVYGWRVSRTGWHRIDEPEPEPLVLVGIDVWADEEASDELLVLDL